MAKSTPEKLDELLEKTSEIKTDVEVMKVVQAEHTKILEGNGHVGLADKVIQIESAVALLQDDKRKTDNKKDKWFWLLIDKFAVPIAMALIMAKILGPLLAK